jgi:hypothetical protein
MGLHSLVRRGWLLLAALSLLLVACDPSATPTDPNVGWMTIVIGANGGGEATVYVSLQHEKELAQIGAAVGHALFDPRDWEVGIRGNGPGADLATVRLASLYTPGPRSSISLPLERLISSLGQFGITRLSFSVCPPDIPAKFVGLRQVSGQPCAERSLSSKDTPGSASVVLQPEPVNVWPMLTLSWIGGVALLVAAFALRRRTSGSTKVALVAAFTVIVLAVLVWFAGELRGPDNAGVSGLLSGGMLVYAQTLGVVALFLFLMGFVVVWRVESRLHDQYPKTHSALTPEG